ncbi:MAG: SDR family oxidoreductase [Candidatus Hydrogenedentes bacterium]|nr:SDR family oxidoreductase [Candidatus Hydrogenedentota bacterium]
MTDIYRKNVLITGAAGGVGRLLAERCVRRGAARVILWDINENALREVAEALATDGVAVEWRSVDLGDPAQIAESAAAGLAGGPVDILVNNAGVVTGKPLAEQDTTEIETTVRVNVLGVIHTTRALLPAMLDRGAGHIVNIASASGLIPVPRLTTYGASKWACLGFSESLRVELRRQAGMRVSTICPSYINTGMFAGVRAPITAPILEPAYVADRIVRAIERNQRITRMPWIVNLVPVLYHALPAPVFDAICGRLLGIYGSMDAFRGHGEPGGPTD